MVQYIIESFCERLPTAPSRVNLSQKLISREGLRMLYGYTPLVFIKNVEDRLVGLCNSLNLLGDH